MSGAMTNVMLRQLKPYVQKLIKENTGHENAKVSKCSFVMSFEKDVELTAVRVISDKGNFEFEIK
jgi:hypothetical protein